MDRFTDCRATQRHHPLQQRPAVVQSLVDRQDAFGPQSPDGRATARTQPQGWRQHVEVIHRVAQRDIDRLDPRLAGQSLPQPRRQLATGAGDCDVNGSLDQRSEAVQSAQESIQRSVQQHIAPRSCERFQMGGTDNRRGGWMGGVGHGIGVRIV